MPAIAEACTVSTGDIKMRDSSGVDIIFKGKSPNLDICQAGEDTCMNVKFGKIEEVRDPLYLLLAVASVVRAAGSYRATTIALP